MVWRVPDIAVTANDNALRTWTVFPDSRVNVFLVIIRRNFLGSRRSRFWNDVPSLRWRSDSPRRDLIERRFQIDRAPDKRLSHSNHESSDPRSCKVDSSLSSGGKAECSACAWERLAGWLPPCSDSGVISGSEGSFSSGRDSCTSGKST